MEEIKNIFLPGKEFTIRALRLGMPIILQNFIMLALNMMDIILLQGLGDTAVASVSVANQSVTTVNLLIFGTCSGASILLAQFRGSRDYASMRKTVMLALTFVISITGCIAAVMMIVPETVTALMTNESRLITYASKYLAIMPVSFILSGISMVFSTLLRCNEKTKLPLIASVFALSLNTGLNYVLIYGKFGAPALGVEGAAIATVISRMVELCIILYFVYGSENQKIKARMGDLFKVRFDFILKNIKIASPVIANEIIWGLGMTLYSAIYGRMGESTVAAMSVASILEQTFAVVALGCGHITTIILGQELGAQRFKQAKQYALALALWSVAIGLVTTFIMILTAPMFVNTVFNNLSEETTSLAQYMIIMFACYMPIRSFNFTNIVGTLRSGGDSLASAILDVSFMYVFSIPIGWYLGVVLRWHPIPVICIMYSEELIKAIAGFIRMMQYKWLRKIG